MLVLALSLFCLADWSFAFETTLTDDDFKNIELMPEDTTTSEDILEKGSYFEGDLKVKLPKNGAQHDSVFGLGLFPMISRYSLWPRSNEVPYTISSSYSAYQRARIADAMREYERKTCVRFVGRTNQRDYIYIFKDDGCYSLVGRVGGRQELSLDDDCIRKGVIIHELMHTLGFFHEQSRFDRDKFVDIVYRNIIPGTEDQFLKYRSSKIDQLGIGYDYGSVLHYGPTAFSRNGRDTIVPKRFGAEIGQRRGFSQKDILKINKLYACQKRKPPPATKAPRRILKTSSSRKQCKDIATNCIYFRDRCSRQSIKDYCRKTCGVCQSDLTNRAEPIKAKRRICKDTLNPGSCGHLKRMGHCTNNAYKEYMAKYCCATCA